jgi:hypothetical protein
MHVQINQPRRHHQPSAVDFLNPIPCNPLGNPPIDNRHVPNPIPPIRRINNPSAA